MKRKYYSTTEVATYFGLTRKWIQDKCYSKANRDYQFAIRPSEHGQWRINLELFEALYKQGELK